MKNEKLEILKRFIGYPTINRLFEIENYEISDFVLSGVIYILERKLNCKNIDSTRRKFWGRMTNEFMFEVFLKFEKTTDVVEYNEESDFVTIALLTEEISVFSTKVIYLKMNKSAIPNV